MNALDDIHSGIGSSRPKSQISMTSLQVQTYYRITCGITSYGIPLCFLTGNIPSPAEIKSYNFGFSSNERSLFLQHILTTRRSYFVTINL